METKPPLIVNAFGGPGVGKSTTAAGLYSLLSNRGVAAALVPEWMKNPVLEERRAIFENQYYIFGKQLQWLLTAARNYRVVVTDAPILLSVVYNQRSPLFNDVILEEFSRFDNFNVLLTRVKPYLQIGRYQDESEARTVDDSVKQTLDRLAIPYIVAPGVEETIAHLADLVIARLSAEATS